MAPVSMQYILKQQLILSQGSRKNNNSKHKRSSRGKHGKGVDGAKKGRGSRKKREQGWKNSKQGAKGGNLEGRREKYSQTEPHCS